MAKRIQHKVHRYKRGKLGKDAIIYKCSLPGCSHYKFPDTVLNQLSICTKCEKEFIMPSRVGLLRANPICPDCANSKILDPVVEQTIDRLLGV
jgi:hypothetical protein